MPWSLLGNVYNWTLSTGSTASEQFVTAAPVYRFEHVRRGVRLYVINARPAEDVDTVDAQATYNGYEKRKKIK